MSKMINHMNIYLASPYTSRKLSVLQARYEEALDALGFLLLEYPEASVYSPIVHFHYVALKYALPADHNYWDRINLPHLTNWATHFAVLCSTGWLFSAGIKWERDKCKDLPTIFLIPEPFKFSTIVKEDGEDYEQKLRRLDNII